MLSTLKWSFSLLIALKDFCHSEVIHLCFLDVRTICFSLCLFFFLLQEQIFKICPSLFPLLYLDHLHEIFFPSYNKTITWRNSFFYFFTCLYFPSNLFNTELSPGLLLLNCIRTFLDEHRIYNFKVSLRDQILLINQHQEHSLSI
jgi:hypothetical protein